MSLLFQLQLWREFFFFSPFQTNVEKTEGNAPLCHLQRTPSARCFRLPLQLLLSLSLERRLSDGYMKDHLAHGPFGKLTYWSSFVDFCCLFFLFYAWYVLFYRKGNARRTQFLDNLGGSLFQTGLTGVSQSSVIGFLACKQIQPQISRP